jgi:hypothetical protein
LHNPSRGAYTGVLFSLLVIGVLVLFHHRKQ